MNQPQQLSLFDIPDKPVRKIEQNRLKMDREALLKWKECVFNHQQQVQQQPVIQTSLFEFETITSSVDANSIDPFCLKLYPSEFYRMPDKGDATCIYFVIDSVSPVLLYVGETKRTPKQRWMQHDCRAYIRTYLDLHRHYNLDLAISLAFWGDTPTNRKARLKLESDLIHKWRSPFNKECWKFWGQPFGK